MAVDQAILIPEYVSGIHPVIAQSNINMNIEMIGGGAGKANLHRSAWDVNLYGRSGSVVTPFSYPNPVADKPSVYAALSNPSPILSSYSFPGSAACNGFFVILEELTLSNGFRIWFDDGASGDVYTYITGSCQLYNNHYGGSSVVAGLIKRGTPIPGCTIADVILGVISSGGTSHFCLNGVELYSYASTTFDGAEFSVYSGSLTQSRDWEKGAISATNSSYPAWADYEYDAKNIDIVFWMDGTAGSFYSYVDSAFAVGAGTTPIPPSARWRSFINSTEQLGS